MTIPADEHRGTQVERTVLSWNRIAIGVAANGVLVMRAGFVHHLVVLEAVGLAIAIVGFALWALSLLRYSTIAGRPASHLFGEEPGAMSLLAVSVLVLSLIDVVVVVFAR